MRMLGNVSLLTPKSSTGSRGLDLLEWFTVSAREGDASELTITLPGLRDPDADLSSRNNSAVFGVQIMDVVVLVL